MTLNINQPTDSCLVSELPQFIRDTRAGINLISAGSGPYINPMAYGAKGDGVTDDTVAIQKAVTDCQLAGGTLFIPATGTSFRTTSPILVTASMAIVGEGLNSTIKNDHGGICILVQGLDVDWFTAKDFSIDGNHTGQADAGLLQINNGKFDVDGVQTYDGGLGALWVSGIACSWNGVGVETTGVIRYCISHDNSKAGIYVSTGSNGVAVYNNQTYNNGIGGGLTSAPGISIVGQRSKVFGNISHSNQGSGILTGSMAYLGGHDGPWNSIIAENICYNNGLGVGDAAGIHIGNIHGTDGDYGYITISNNQCNNNDDGLANFQRGIIVQNTNHVIIKGNQCNYNRVQGIYLDNVDNSSVEGNIVMNNAVGAGAYGIGFSNCNNITVKGNRVGDDQLVKTQDYALGFLNTNSGFVIEGNDFSGNIEVVVVSGSLPNSLVEGNNFGWSYSIHNIQSYGADSSGAADCSAALATALIMCPSNIGGTILFPSGIYKFSSNIVISKTGIKIVLNNAKLDMGANQIIVSPYTGCGFTIEGQGGYGLPNQGASSRTAWIDYTGVGSAIQVGNFTAPTQRIRISDVFINVTGVGAKALSLNFVQFAVIERIRVYASGTTQTGICLDGTGQYCGHISILDPDISGGKYGIHLTGGNISYIGPCNSISIIGGTIGGTVFSGSCGIRIDSDDSFSPGVQHSNGNVILGTNIENWETGLSLENDVAFNNFTMVRIESCTKDIKFGADTHDNLVNTYYAVSVTDNGVRNNVISPEVWETVLNP